MANDVVTALLAHGRRLGASVRPSTRRHRLSGAVANAFVLGVMLDRSVQAQWAWDAAESMQEMLGDPADIRGLWLRLVRMEKRRLTGYLRYGNGGRVFHRHYKTFVRLLPLAAQHVLDEYNGDPRRIWNDTQDVPAVRRRFEAIPGIGMALSRMAVLMLARDYGVLGGRAALPQLDVKPDIHVVRVFRRCGLTPPRATRDEVIAAAQRWHPRFPAALDAPAFNLGRTWCRPTRPKCGECPLAAACPRIGLPKLARA